MIFDKRWKLGKARSYNKQQLEQLYMIPIIVEDSKGNVSDVVVFAQQPSILEFIVSEHNYCVDNKIKEKIANATSREANPSDKWRGGAERKS